MNILNWLRNWAGRTFELPPNTDDGDQTYLRLSYSQVTEIWNTLEAFHDIQKSEDLLPKSVVRTMKERYVYARNLLDPKVKGAT